jgi:hypothetical protein
LDKIDKIMELIRTESDLWRTEIANLPAEVAGQLNSTLENQVTTLVSGAIGTAGATTACQLNTVKAGLLRDLSNIKFKILIFSIKTSKKCKRKRNKSDCKEQIKEYEKSIEKQLVTVCIPVPTAIKFNQTPSGSLLSFYGSGLTDKRVKLEIEKCDGKKVDISKKLNFQSSYLASIEVSEIGNGYWPQKDHRKLILTDKKLKETLSEIPITNVVYNEIARTDLFGGKVGSHGNYNLMPENYPKISKIDIKHHNYIDNIRITVTIQRY